MYFLERKFLEEKMKNLEFLQFVETLPNKLLPLLKQDNK